MITNARFDGDREVDDTEVFANIFVGEIKSGGERPIGTVGRWKLISVVGCTYVESCCFKYARRSRRRYEFEWIDF